MSAAENDLTCSSGCRNHFHTHRPLWSIVWKLWNGEWGAESHHYGSSIIMSLPWCLSMCHRTFCILPCPVEPSPEQYIISLATCIAIFSPNPDWSTRQWCPTMHHGWSRDCSFLFQLVVWAAVPSRDGELIKKLTLCRLCKERLQTLGPSRNLFAHHSTWCPKYSQS